MSAMGNSATNQASDQGEFIKAQLQKYLSHWVWFVLGLTIALTTAFLYLRYTPRVYRSSAKIKILNKTKGLELPSSAFIFNRSNINLENEIEILKSYDIIKQVVDSLDLTMRVYEEGNILTTELNRLPFKVIKKFKNDSIFRYSSYRIEVTPKGFDITREGQEKVFEFSDYTTSGVSHPFPFELDAQGVSNFKELEGKTYLLKLAPISAVTGALKGQINVSMIGKASDLLQLNYASQSREKNERILNALIAVFNQDGIKDRQKVSLKTKEFILSRFNSLSEELEAIELEIRDYKQTNNFLSIESDAELGLSQRSEAESELFNLETQLLLSDLLEQALTTPSDDSDLLPANIGLASGDINSLVSNFNTLVLQRDNLISSAGSNNPNLKMINSKLDDLRSNIFTSIKNYKVQLGATKTQLERKNKKFAAQVYNLPTKEKAILEKKRLQEIKQTLYLFLLQKQEEASINYAITEPTIKVVELARSPGGPISPIPRSVYLTALAFGLLVPFGIIYVLQLLDTKIKSRSDIEQRTTKIPVVGELPKIKDDKLMFTNPNDMSIQAEAFRILSSNVDYILPVTEETKGKVIYCTSTIKGEGKTYVSINLSLALSSLNKKVLLIGADLRNPQIHGYIGKDKQQLGLSNYLHDLDFDWRAVLIKGFNLHPNHDTLLSGIIPPNPAHLLTNGRFKKLIEEAKLEYDYIIVDTAPTILVTDTMLISQLADATIYITRADFTEKKLLEYSMGLFESGKLKNMAYVVNSVGASRTYGYSYNYGYNYGYGNKA